MKIRIISVAAMFVISSSTATVTDDVRGREWMIGALRLSVAHRISEGSGIVVGLIDTGVFSHHADLSGSILPGVDLSSGVPVGSGTTDVDGHGTAMAALIVAHGHGADEGVLGVAPAAKILPIRNGEHKSVFLAAAIDWAVQHGARVISISTGQSGPDAGLVAAVGRAVSADVVVVAAVGDRPRDNQVLFPAALPGVLAVGGTDRLGNPAAVSVVSPGVLIVAPAVNVISGTRNGGYATVTGTSAATAIVAGAVALVRSRFPDLSAPEVIRRLEVTALDKGPEGQDEAYGYGLLDIVAALGGSVSSAPTVTSSRLPSPPSQLMNSTSSAHASRSSAVAHGPADSTFTPVVVIGLLVAFMALLGGRLVLPRARRRGGG